MQDIEASSSINEAIQPEIEPMPVEASQELQPTKVHVRGLDNLTTEDIKSFVSEHYESASFQRVEWINDTSANLTFETESDASQALEALSNYPPDYSSALTSTELREAKGFLRKPEANLQIRIAFVTDRKQARAHEASRFYLMHPEADPRERRRRDRGKDLQERRYHNTRRRRRKSDDEVEHFDASMYDDDAGALAKRITGRVSRRTSRSYSGAGSEVEEYDRRHIDSYRPRSSRDRSASPDTASRRTRKRTPPPAYHVRDPYPTPRENHGKELFPTKSGIISESNNGSRELFPNKTSAVGIKKELFPAKKNRNHRRSDAFDAADETADLFANRLAVAQAGAGSGGKRYINGVLQQSPNVTAASRGGVVDDSDSMPALSGGISVRGASTQGVSIRGFAEGSTKELSPQKMGNAGKELFAEKLQGRGGRRNRAEDMFS